MAVPDSEIINIVQEVNKREQSDKEEKPWIAFEYFPPRTEQGVQNLYDRFGRMKRHNPLYVDVTWGAGGSTSDLTMELCIKAQKEFSFTANMHLTCTNMDRTKLDKAVKEAKENNIRNILALRGDPPAGAEKWEKVDSGFACALDLIKFLKEKEGDYFHISCAAYPEGHPQRIKKVEPGTKLSESELSRVSTRDGEQYVCSDEDYKEELIYLKKKQDAGAEMAVTQMFFDTQVFFRFVKDCKEFGITMPIIPGLMCITAYGGFKRMISFCQTRVPQEVLDSMESIKDDQDKVKEYGVRFGTKMCQELIDGGVKGLHFYTLNLDSVVDGILKNLGLGGDAAE